MYEAWFQLDNRPFNAAPQIVDYYPSRSMEAARHALVRGIEADAGPGMIIGGTGMGKTTLCLKLEQQYRDTQPSAYISCCGIQSRRELLQNILSAFDLPYEGSDEGELRISFANFARSNNEQNILLIFDDVADLPSESLDELRSLSNITDNGAWCVHMILAGKTELEERLGTAAMESFEQRISSRNYLASYNGQETSDYIQFQLTRCGGDTTKIFSASALEQIYSTTDGVPRRVNQLCDQALIMAALGNVEQLESIHVEEAWADLQQLPAPKRDLSSPADNQDNVLEFGSLDDGNDDPPPSDVDSPVSDEVRLTENTSNDDAPQPASAEEAVADAFVEFGELPPENGDQHQPQDESAEQEAYSSDPVELNGATTKSDPAIDDPQPDQPTSLPPTDSSKADLVDRLDDIEREVQRVSTELDGEDQLQRTAQPPVAPGNPFLEIFDEDELVFSTHMTLNNEIVRRQPPVFSGGGESLINVMRMVDQRGPAETPWERLEDVGAPAPPDPSLSMEVAPLPVRDVPEIQQANTASIEFSDGQFRFNYAAPIASNTQSGSDAAVPPAANPHLPSGEITGSSSHPETLVISSSGNLQRDSSGGPAIDVVQVLESSSSGPMDVDTESHGMCSPPTDELPADEIVAVVDCSQTADTDVVEPNPSDAPEEASMPIVLEEEHLADDGPSPGADVTDSDEGESHASTSGDDSTSAAILAAELPNEPSQPTKTKRPKRRRFNKLFSDLKSSE